MAAFFTLDRIEDLDGEEWRTIRGYDGKYLISNYSRVKSLKNYEARLLSPQENNKGYLRVALCKDGRTRYFLLHRLVAVAFVENDDPIEKNTVDHIDGNKLNNNASNLRWLSLSDNIRAYYAQRNKLQEKPKDETILFAV